MIRHPGAAAVVPFLDPRTILLVRQFRHAAGGFLLEIPAGKLDPGEPPEVCAARETEEEVGYRAGRLEKLGAILTTPGFTDEIIHLYAGFDLVPTERRPSRRRLASHHVVNRRVARRTCRDPDGRRCPPAARRADAGHGPGVSRAVSPRAILAGMVVGGGLGVLAHVFAADSPALAWMIRNVTEPAGTVFLRLLFVLVIPILISALPLGIVGVGDLRALGRVCWKTLAYTVVVSVICVFLGVGLVTSSARARRCRRN
jgi:8-oxo-dGTP pyrophosphatase MutT (NUDIX family)